MKKLKRFLLSALVILIISEVVIRITFSDILREQLSPVYVLDSIAGYVYKPNYTHKIVNSAFSNVFTTNSLGFNWNEFSKDKPKDVYRIIILGASDETGVYTNGPDNYIKLVQEKFNKSGHKVEIQNWTVDGKYSGLRRLKIIKERCLEYDPDLILNRISLPIAHTNVCRMNYKGYNIRFNGNVSLTDDVKNFIDSSLVKKSLFTLTYDLLYSYRLYVRYCAYNEVFNVDKGKSFVKKCIHPIMRSLLAKKEVVNAYVSKIVWVVNENISPKEFFVTESINKYKEISQWLAMHDVQFALFNTYFTRNDAIYKAILNQNHINYLTPQIKYQNNFNFGELDGHSNQIGHRAIANGFYKVLQDFYFNRSGDDKLIASESINASIKREQKDWTQYFKWEIAERQKKRYDSCNILILSNSNNNSTNLYKTMATLFYITEDKVELTIKPYNGGKLKIANFSDSLLELRKKNNYDIILVDIPIKLAYTYPQKFSNTMRNVNRLMYEHNTKLLFYCIQKNINDNIIPLIEFLFRTNNLTFLKKQIFTPNWVSQKYGNEEFDLAYNLLISEFLYDTLRASIIVDGYVSSLTNFSSYKSINTNGFIHGNFKHVNAIDGSRFDDEQKFIRTWPWSSVHDSTSDKRITIDLETTCLVSKMVIYPLSNGTRYPTEISLFLSNDSINWDTIPLAQEENAIDLSSRTPLIYSFTETPARYVMITAPRTRISDKNIAEEYVISFNEIEFYGKKKE